MLMWIHPILQILAVLTSLYVIHLGWARFQMVHLARKGIMFQWKRHVHLGTAVLAVWGLVFFIGLGAAWWAWKSILITGPHYITAFVMFPMVAFGYFSGLRMDKVKKKRKGLPLAHAVCNAILVLLALFQFYTGIYILKDMVLG